MGNILALF